MQVGVQGAVHFLAHLGIIQVLGFCKPQNRVQYISTLSISSKISTIPASIESREIYILKDSG